VKAYVGKRNPEPEALVETPDRPPYPLHHFVRHSPTGFEWGYGGSGPADLALSILVDLIGLAKADQLYQQFKWDVVAQLPRSGWRLSETRIQEWLHQVRLA